MTDKLHPWQEKFLVDIESGGIKPGEMMGVMMVGRNTGKSIFNSAYIKQLLESLTVKQPISEIQLDTGTVYGARY